MTQSSTIEQPYHICTIDIGSPGEGNLSWCLKDVLNNQEFTGNDLNELFPHLIKVSESSGLIFGLEAPLFVPVRNNVMRATKGRKGEGNRSWSAIAGATVLAINLPIMVYIFRRIHCLKPHLSYSLNENNFSAKANEMMIFEAFVAREDKGSSHIEDAKNMVESCLAYSKRRTLPPSILENEKGTEYFNLAAAALLRCGICKDPQSLHLRSPVYSPSSNRSG